MAWVQTCCRVQSSVGKNAEGQRLVAVQVPRVIRVVNRTTKEGEQCARLLSFRGRRCGPRPSVLVWKSRHSATSATLTLGMPVPSACRRAVPLAPRSSACPRFALTRPAAPPCPPAPCSSALGPPLHSALRPQLSPEPRSSGPAGDIRRAVHPPLSAPGYGKISS